MAEFLFSKFSCFYSFLLRFFFADIDNSQESRKRKGLIFVPLYHFHPLTNIQTFVALIVRWLPRIFIESQVSPACYSMRFTTLEDCRFIDWRWNLIFILLDDLILDFSTVIWHWLEKQPPEVFFKKRCS